MERSTVLAAALTLVVALAAPAAAGSLGLAGAPSDPAATAGNALGLTPENNTTKNASSDDPMPPGAKLAGVVSVQGAEVSGEVAQRAFGHRIAAANSNASKASVVASQTETLESRLAEIRAEQDALRQRYENDTISQGRYKARMAKLAAEARTVQRLIETTAQAASSLPAATLRQQGVNPEHIASLREHARNLTGPEVAAIATEVAGKNVGRTNRSTGPPAGVTTGQGGGWPGTGADGTSTNANRSTGTPGVNGTGPVTGQNATNRTPGVNWPPGVNGTPGSGPNGPLNDTLANASAANASTSVSEF